MDDQIIRVWNARTGSIAGEIHEPFGGSAAAEYAALGFSPDGKWLIRAQEGWHMEGNIQAFVDSFVVHDTSSWQRVWALRTQPVALTAVGISADGRYAAVTGDERLEAGGSPYLQPKILLVSLEDRRVVRAVDIMSPDCDVPFVAWRPDGRRIAVGGRAVFAGSRITGAAIEILDPTTGAQLAEYTHSNTRSGAHVLALFYSPDNRYLMIGWDEMLEIWDSDHKKLLQNIRGKISAATVSRDGKYLAVATEDHGIHVWRVRD
jgi:WD40 repeat protein